MRSLSRTCDMAYIIYYTVSMSTIFNHLAAYDVHCPTPWPYPSRDNCLGNLTTCICDRGRHNDLQHCQFVRCENTNQDALSEAIARIDRPIQGIDLLHYKDFLLPRRFLDGKIATTVILEEGHIGLNKIGLTALENDTFAGLSGVSKILVRGHQNMKVIERLTFLPLENLSEIVIVDNPSLEKLQLNLETMSNLTALDLSANNLSFVEMPLFHPNVKTQHVRLTFLGGQETNLQFCRSNKLICNCSLAWVKQSTWKNNDRTLGQCSGPPVLRGQFIFKLRLEDFGNCDTGGVLASGQESYCYITGLQYFMTAVIILNLPL